MCGREFQRSKYKFSSHPKTLELTGRRGIIVHYIRDISDKLCALEDICIDAGRYRGLRGKNLLFENPQNNFRAFINVWDPSILSLQYASRLYAYVFILHNVYCSCDPLTDTTTQPYAWILGCVVCACVNYCSIDHDIWPWIYRSLSKPTIQPNHQLKLFCNTQTYRLQYIPVRTQRHLKLTLWHIFKTILNREQTCCLFVKPIKCSYKC